MTEGERVAALSRSLSEFLARPPWGWHRTFDGILALLLPAVVAVSSLAAWKAHRRRGDCDNAERGDLRERVTALGLLLLCLSVMRLTYLAEERLACIAYYQVTLLTTNRELFVDWLRAAWFPILAAAAGGWLSYFGWTRFRPAPAEQDSTTPAGG